MSRKLVTERTGERLIRLAHEMEELANRLKDEDFQEQFDVRRASSMLGNAGRCLLDTLEARGHQDAYKQILRSAPPRGQHDT